MGGQIINCMGMAMENILGRQGAALSRNSDDFVPDEPEKFGEHLIQNAYNAVHLIFSLGFGTQSADEVLKSELNRERFGELAQEMPIYAQYPNEKQETYIKNLVRGAFAHGPELDDYISRYAVGWSFERIPRMAAAIMRTAMYEILYMPDIPNAAAINAAVELTKQYEPQEVAAFVNGILGSFVRAEFQDTPAKPEKAAARTETAPEA